MGSVYSGNSLGSNDAYQRGLNGSLSVSWRAVVDPVSYTLANPNATLECIASSSPEVQYDDSNLNTTQLETSEQAEIADDPLNQEQAGDGADDDGVFHTHIRRFLLRVRRLTPQADNSTHFVNTSDASSGNTVVQLDGDLQEGANESVLHQDVEGSALNDADMQDNETSFTSVVVMPFQQYGSDMAAAEVSACCDVWSPLAPANASALRLPTSREDWWLVPVTASPTRLFGRSLAATGVGCALDATGGPSAGCHTLVAVGGLDVASVAPVYGDSLLPSSGYVLSRNLTAAGGGAANNMADRWVSVAAGKPDADSPAPQLGASVIAFAAGSSAIVFRAAEWQAGQFDDASGANPSRKGLFQCGSVALTTVPFEHLSNHSAGGSSSSDAWAAAQVSRVLLAYGNNVAVHGGHLAVGGLESSSMTGKVEVFKSGNGASSCNWQPVQVFSGTAPTFGAAVGISSTFTVVTEPAASALAAHGSLMALRDAGDGSTGAAWALSGRAYVLQHTNASAPQVTLLPPAGPEPSFGTAVALSGDGKVVVVGSPLAASGRGRADVWSLALDNNGDTTAEHVCGVEGPVLGAGLGASVDIGTPLGTDVAIAGAPGVGQAFLVEVQRAPGGGPGVCTLQLQVESSVTVSTSASSSASPLPVAPWWALDAAEHGGTGMATAAQASTLLSAAQATGAQYGFGAAVAMQQQTAIAASPWQPTWRNAGAATATNVTALEARGDFGGARWQQGGSTGALALLSYCAPGAALTDLQPSLGGAKPRTMCRRCEGGELAGRRRGMCEDCSGPLECVASSRIEFHATPSNIPLQNGEQYVVDVQAQAASLRTSVQSSPAIVVDNTPPDTGSIIDGIPRTGEDGADYNASDPDACAYCEDDIDYTADGTRFTASWCCGFEDLESGLASYEYALTTSNSPPLPEWPSYMAAQEPTLLLPWRNLGLNATMEVMGLGDVEQDTTVYSCVRALNTLGLPSPPLCSNGVLVDRTPPVALFVNDGVSAEMDSDQQVMTNAIFATYGFADNTSGIFEHQWNIGSAPELGDVQDWVTVGGNTSFAALFGATLRNGTTYYVCLRARNMAGLMSDVLCSDGIKVGKAEVAVNPASTAQVTFDTASVGDETNDRDESDVNDPDAPEEAPKETVGMMSVPAGSVDSEVVLTAGVVKPEEGDGVDASLLNDTQKPANNFKFGGYSFSIDAASPDGSPLPGFKFAKPIVISMWYDVQALADGEQSDFDFEPSLQLYDTVADKWIDASETCDPPFKEVNHVTRRFTVHICHLTQFGLFATERPTAVARTPNASLSSPAAVLPPAYKDAPANAVSQMVVVPYDAVAIAATPISIVLDASSSFDPDGNVTSYYWDVWRGSMAFGGVSFADANASFTVATFQNPGTFVVRTTVTDNDRIARSATVVVVINRAPVATVAAASTNVVLAASAAGSAVPYVGSMLITAAMQDADVPAAASERDVLRADRLYAAGSYTWSILTAPPGVGPGSLPVGVLSVPSNATSVTVAPLQPGDYTVGVVVTDVHGAASAMATASFVAVHLEPVVAASPATVYLHEATSTVLSALDSVGTIERLEWEVTARTDHAGAPTGQAPEHGLSFTNGNRTTPQVTLGGLTPGFYTITLRLYGPCSSVCMRSATTVVEASPLIPPAPVLGAGHGTLDAAARTVTLDGSTSHDLDGHIAAIKWEVAWTNDVRGSGVGQGGYWIEHPTGQLATVLHNVTVASYRVRLTVTDDSGLTHSTTTAIEVDMALAVTVSVSNLTVVRDADVAMASTHVDAAVTATIVPDATAFVWRVASFTPRLSVHSSADLSSITFLLDSDGDNQQAALTSGALVNGVKYPGTYRFECRVTVPSGVEVVDSVVVFVNEAPSAVLEPFNAAVHVKPAAGGALASVMLDATASGDRDGQLVSAEWRLTSNSDQRAAAAGAAITTAASAGAVPLMAELVGVGLASYTVEVTLTDNEGAKVTLPMSLSLPMTVAVTTAPEQLLVTLPATSVQLEAATASALPPDAVTVQWSTLAAPAQASPSASSVQLATTLTGLTLPGVYTMRLVATSASGATASNTVQVVVNAPPVAALDMVSPDGSLVSPAVAHTGRLGSQGDPVVVVLSAASSEDSDGAIASVMWRVIPADAATQALAPPLATNATGVSTVARRESAVTVAYSVTIPAPAGQASAAAAAAALLAEHVTVALHAVGTFDIKVEVSDKHGANSTAMMSVTVQPAAATDTSAGISTAVIVAAIVTGVIVLLCGIAACVYVRRSSPYRDIDTVPGAQQGGAPSRKVMTKKPTPQELYAPSAPRPPVGGDKVAEGPFVETGAAGAPMPMPVPLPMTPHFADTVTDFVPEKASDDRLHSMVHTAHVINVPPSDAAGAGAGAGAGTAGDAAVLSSPQPAQVTPRDDVLLAPHTVLDSPSDAMDDDGGDDGVVSAIDAAAADTGSEGGNGSDGDDADADAVLAFVGGVAAGVQPSGGRRSGAQLPALSQRKLV